MQDRDFSWAWMWGASKRKGGRAEVEVNHSDERVLPRHGSHAPPKGDAIECASSALHFPVAPRKETLDAFEKRRADKSAHHNPHPTPHNPHPTPHTPHPTTHTLHTKPHDPHPTLYTPNPTHTPGQDSMTAVSKQPTKGRTEVNRRVLDHRLTTDFTQPVEARAETLDAWEKRRAG